MTPIPRDAETITRDLAGNILEVDRIPILPEDEAFLAIESIPWSWLGGKPVGAPPVGEV